MGNTDELERVIAMVGLEKYFENLIAQKKHVRPEDVTEEYIRRERQACSAMRHDDSQYGGDTTRGLQVLTRDEIDAAAARMAEARKNLHAPGRYQRGA